MPTTISPTNPNPPPFTIWPASQPATAPMTSQIIMVSGAMVCPSPWAASFVPSPLRQAARDAGRLGRLPNRHVTAFACHLPADKRAEGLALPHCTMIGGCARLARGHAFIHIDRNHRCSSRKKRFGQGRTDRREESHGSRHNYDFVRCWGSHWLRRLRACVPLDLESHHTCRVRVEDNYLLAGRGHSHPRFYSHRRSSRC